MGSDIIRWVHLSDLHLEKGQESDIQHVLNLLWVDLDEQIAVLGGPLDLAFFSGDLARNGSEEEYMAARKRFILPLLEHTGLDASRLYLVPGNHDVSWAGESDPDDPKTTKVDLSGSIKEALKSPKEADKLWESALANTHIFPRMAAFDAFSKKAILKRRLPACTKTHRPPVGDQRRLDIVMLNSAWVSGLTKDQASGEPHDAGSLLVTSRQLDAALGVPADADLRVLIMHHPIDWLNERDRKIVAAQICGACQIILHGHLHIPTIQIVETPQGQSIVIPAGSLYKGSDHLNGYNLVELDLRTGCGTVVLRRSTPQLDQWTNDTQSTGGRLNGYYPFIVRSLFEKARGEDETPDLDLLERAYRITPSVPETGRQHYWHAYNRLQVAKSRAGLRLLARMVRMQSRWLEDAERWAELADAAAFLYDESPEEELAELALREWLAAGDLPEQMAFEAHFLLARLLDDPPTKAEACEDGLDKAETFEDGLNKAEAFEHFTRVTELGREEWINKQVEEDQTATTEKIIRSYIQRAYSTRDDKESEIRDLRRAEDMASAIKNPDLYYRCRSTRVVLEGRDKDDRPQRGVEQHPKKEEAIRSPAEQQLWKQAEEGAERGDRGERYYWSAAMHHGLGFHLKRIEVEVRDDGSAGLTGTCHLLATREVGVLDNYLQTLPGESDVFTFKRVRGLSPGYTPRLVDVGTPGLARVYIAIDPPLPPGKELQYVWEAEARAKTIATTAEALREFDLPFEWMSWQVIVPIRLLEIAVTIPSRQDEPLPKFWSDLWRIGPVPKPQTAAYRGAVEAAYLAQTGEGLGGVKVESVLLPPNRRQLTLTADHPWLAFRQVLAWEIG
jgi:UDP-2,3-diacylglucosamine pyrophosphatase LpxH